MRLGTISIKVFTNILLGRRENFEKILGFRVYSAIIIFRTPEENLKKVLCNRKNFRIISKNFWLNLENNEEIFGEIRRFFSEILKRLGKFRRCTGKFPKSLKILWGTLTKILKKWIVNFEKMKNKFWKNFLDKKCIKSKRICNSTFAPNKSSLSRLSIASYMSLVYIRANCTSDSWKNNFCRSQQWSFTHLHTEMVVISNCVLSVLVISFIFQH